MYMLAEGTDASNHQARLNCSLLTGRFEVSEEELFATRLD
jgi:hypothetical protein